MEESDGTQLLSLVSLGRGVRLVCTLAVLLIPGVALASDFSGMVTIIVGLPTLFVANLVGAGLLMYRPSRLATWTAALVLVPVLIAGIWLITDALALFRGTPTGIPFGVVYLGLLAVLAVLVVKLLRRPHA